MTFYAESQDEEQNNQESNPVGEAVNSVGDLKDKVDSAKNLKDFADRAHGAGKYAQQAGNVGKASGALGSSAGGASAATAGSAAGSAAGAGAGAAAGAGGGAAAGASAGAAAGSVVPGAGTAIGAVAGTALGSAASSKTGRRLAIGAILLGCSGCLAAVALPFLIVLLVVLAVSGINGGDVAEASPGTGSTLLTIAKTSSPASFPKGAAGSTGTVTFTFTVTNTSDKEALGVKIVDSFTGKYTSEITGKETCSLDVGTVAAKSSVNKSCTVTIRLDDDWSFTDVAVVTGTIAGAEQTSSKGLLVKIGNPPAVEPSGWPSSGRVTQLPYCNPTSDNNCISHAGLAGIDLGTGGVSGFPVYATHDGYATTGNNGTKSYGLYVLVTGPTYTTMYGHLQAVNSACVPGQVKAGALIGYGDTTGNSTGNHLHYEIRHSSDGSQATLSEFNSLVPSYSIGSEVTASYGGNPC